MSVVSDYGRAKSPAYLTLQLLGAVLAAFFAGLMLGYAAFLQLSANAPACQADPIAALILQDEAARASL